MFRSIIFSIFLLIFQFSPQVLKAQGFRVATVLGINASQVDGDNLAGYDKLGFMGGLRINYQTNTKLNAVLELLVSQRGSRSELTFGSPTEIQGISLNYVEIPLLLTLEDWYDEDHNFNKVRAEAGFSYAYLFDASSENTSFDGKTEMFKNSDFSYIFGIAYKFSHNVGVGLRYTRSITKIYENQDKQFEALINYYITLRAEYHF